MAGLPARCVGDVGNLSYSGLFEDREITLAGGVYTATSDAETIVVHLLDSYVALGDLNGDGSQDAVALLELDTSGSGRFTFAAPVRDVLTTPTVGTAVEVGDHIQPNALSIADGQVVAEYIGLGAGDGDCCPSWNIRHTFAWQDGALVEVSREEVSKVEAAAARDVAFSDAWAPVRLRIARRSGRDRGHIRLRLRHRAGEPRGRHRQDDSVGSRAHPVNGGKPPVRP